jgi:hypothetical protein
MTDLVSKSAGCFGAAPCIALHVLILQWEGVGTFVAISTRFDYLALSPTLPPVFVDYFVAAAAMHIFLFAFSSLVRKKVVKSVARVSIF